MLHVNLLILRKYIFLNLMVFRSIARLYKRKLMTGGAGLSVTDEGERDRNLVLLVMDLYSQERNTKKNNTQ